MQLTIQHTLTTAPPTPSSRVLHAAAMFGLGIDRAQTVELIPPTELELGPHRVLFITGPSGSGKSTLLRRLGEAAVQRGLPVVDLDGLPTPADRPLVDLLSAEDAADGLDDVVGVEDFSTPPAGLERALRLLSLAGLGDAFVMLRRPSELSDGQRARLRLALAMEAAEAEVSRGELTGEGVELAALLVADEFGATLDRQTAVTLAASVRRFADRCPVTVAVATTHDDLLEALSPDVLVYKPLGEGVEVVRAGGVTADGLESD
ncbi:MAG: ATP-binding cassette domain-containing protein [Planctomycetota bacterium]